MTENQDEFGHPLEPPAAPSAAEAPAPAPAPPTAPAPTPVPASTGSGRSTFAVVAAALVLVLAAAAGGATIGHEVWAGSPSTVVSVGAVPGSNGFAGGAPFNGFGNQSVGGTNTGRNQAGGGSGSF